MKKQYSYNLIPALIVFGTVMTRFIFLKYNVWPNFAPLAAVGLFSGYTFRNKEVSYSFPIIAYLLSDLTLQLFSGTPGFYGVSQLFVYGSMLLIVWLGRQVKNVSAGRIAGFSVLGSAAFWVISNFGVWFSQLFYPVGQRMYTADPAGLLTCYKVALPFYNAFSKEAFIGTFAGDLIYNFALFGLYAAFVVKSMKKASV